MIIEYRSESAAIDRFDETNLKSGKMDMEIETCIKNFQNDNKLPLDPLAMKALDKSRE